MLALGDATGSKGGFRISPLRKWDFAQTPSGLHPEPVRRVSEGGVVQERDQREQRH